MRAEQIKIISPKPDRVKNRSDIHFSDVRLDPAHQPVQKLNTLLEECPLAYYQSSLDGRIQVCNYAFVKLIGFPTQEDALSYTMGRTKDDLSYLPAGNTLLPDGTKYGGRKRTMHRKDGRVLHVIETIAGMFNESNELVGIRGFLLDQTERVMLEERLLQRQKMESLGLFTGGFVHDFNNILDILLGNCTLLEKKLPQEGEIPKLLTSMQQALKRGIDLAQNFLTYARTNEVAMETMNVNTVIKGLSKMVKASLPKSIRLELELDDHLPMVAMNPTQIQQAVLNLCLNARDAMADTAGTRSAIPVLKIRTSQVNVQQHQTDTPRHLCIEVSDTGKGMNPSLTQEILNPFFTTKKQGTGLGLTIVQMVTKKHHGFIDVASKEGEGTTVKLLFPFSQISSTPMVTHPIKEVRNQERHETILFAEGDESLALAVKTCFESKGYNVLLVRDGIAAIQCYEKNKQMIDIVFLDLDASLLDGEQVFTVLRDLEIQQGVILASAHIGAEEQQGLLLNGLCEFIPKPYVPHDVLQSIRKILNSVKKQTYPAIFSTSGSQYGAQDHSP